MALPSVQDRSGDRNESVTLERSETYPSNKLVLMLNILLIINTNCDEQLTTIIHINTIIIIIIHISNQYGYNKPTNDNNKHTN